MRCSDGWPLVADIRWTAVCSPLDGGCSSGEEGPDIVKKMSSVLRGAKCPTLVVRGDRASSLAGPLRSVLCAIVPPGCRSGLSKLHPLIPPTGLDL